MEIWKKMYSLHSALYEHEAHMHEVHTASDVICAGQAYGDEACGGNMFFTFVIIIKHNNTINEIKLKY